MRSKLDLERGGDRGAFPPRQSHGAARWLRRNAFWLVLILVLAIMIMLMRRFAHSKRSLNQDSSDDQTRMICQERMLNAGWISESSASFARSLVYSKMALGSKGHLTLGGIVTQGLKQSDLFSFSISHVDGSSRASVIVSPILKSLEIPVRAVVAPLLDQETSRRIKAAVQSALLPSDRDRDSPLLPAGSIWLQDDQMYHASLYHASSHMSPIKASRSEVEDEAGAVSRVAEQSCPIQAILDRVILTSGGVVVACFQILPDGSEPSEIRHALSRALPNSPPASGQAVKEPTMLHVTIARLLLPPEELGVSIEEDAAIQAVTSLSKMLCGLEAEFDTLWFIEEQDLLALALRGRFVKHEAKMTCPTR